MNEWTPFESTQTAQKPAWIPAVIRGKMGWHQQTTMSSFWWDNRSQISLHQWPTSTSAAGLKENSVVLPHRLVGWGWLISRSNYFTKGRHIEEEQKHITVNMMKTTGNQNKLGKHLLCELKAGDKQLTCRGDIWDLMTPVFDTWLIRF